MFVAGGNGNWAELPVGVKQSLVVSWALSHLGLSLSGADLRFSVSRDTARYYADTAFLDFWASRRPSLSQCTRLNNKFTDMLSL